MTGPALALVVAATDARAEETAPAPTAVDQAALDHVFRRSDAWNRTGAFAGAAVGVGAIGAIYFGLKSGIEGGTGFDIGLGVSLGMLSGGWATYHATGVAQGVLATRAARLTGGPMGGPRAALVAGIVGAALVWFPPFGLAGAAVGWGVGRGAINQIRWARDGGRVSVGLQPRRRGLAVVGTF